MHKRPLGFTMFTVTSCLIVLQVMAVSLSSRSISSYGTIYSSSTYFVVALDGSGNFENIQTAIDALPSSGGIIEVRDGIYDLNPETRYPYNSITVRSDLTIKGMGIDRTVIRSFPTKQSYGSDVRAMTITSSGDIRNLVIEDLTVIQNGTPDNMGWDAIDLRGGTNVNIQIRNVKVTDVTGAGIGIPRFNNVIVENCIIERAWTGITFVGGSNGLIRRNGIFDTLGDGIFPQAAGLSVTDLTIEDNYLENVGDCAIDITSDIGAPPHERITAQRNTLKNGIIRVSYAQHIQVTGNTIENGFIDIDNGMGPVVDVIVDGNKINTNHEVGIGFYGARDCRATNNQVYMTVPPGGIVQSGISASIWSTGLIESNTIVNPANYGINFAGWGLGGGSSMTIRGNTILDFGEIGIYDDGKSQGAFIIEDNVIWDRRVPFVSRYGIRTDYEANVWTIIYNHIYAGSISFVSAPSSNIHDNIYGPP